jgi:hypothetical protein
MEYFGFKFGKITIINILKKALTTVGHTGCKAWGEKANTLIKEILSKQAISTNQESPATLRSN